MGSAIAGDFFGDATAAPSRKTELTDREISAEDASELLEFWYQGMRARMEMELVFGAGLMSGTDKQPG
jgi:hypothetical protein